MEKQPSGPSPDKQSDRAKQKKIFELLEDRRQRKIERQEKTEAELDAAKELKAQMAALLERNKQAAEANLTKPARNETIDLPIKKADDTKVWDNISTIDDPKKKTKATKALAQKMTKELRPAKNKTALPDLKKDIDQRIAAIQATKKLPSGDPPIPKTAVSNEQARIELQKETQKLKDAVTEKRNAYASADLAITGSWAKIKNALPLTKEKPNPEVIKMKEEYQKALKAYADFQLEKIAHIPDEAARKKEMRVIYLEMSSTEATNLLDTKWNMKAEAMRKRNDVTSNAIIGLTKLGEKWRKISWKKKLILSAAVFGAGVLSTAWGPAAIIAGLGGAAMRGLGTFAAYKGSEQMMEAGARGLRERKTEKEIESEQKNDDWYESLSEKLDAKIVAVDVDLRKLERGQTLRKGTALAFAGFVASGMPGRLLHGWGHGIGDWYSNHFTQHSPNIPSSGVATHSIGNHGLAQSHQPKITAIETQGNIPSTGTHKLTNSETVGSYASKWAKGIKSWFSDHFTYDKPNITSDTVASHGASNHNLLQHHDIADTKVSGAHHGVKITAVSEPDTQPSGPAMQQEAPINHPGGSNIPETHHGVKITAVSEPDIAPNGPELHQVHSTPTAINPESLHAPEINHANYLAATNGVETAFRGDSVWKMIGRQLEARYSENFSGLSPEQKTYVIDHLKNMVQKHPGEFGLADADKIRIGQQVDLSKLFENTSSVRSAFTQAANLDQTQLENIARNNKTILSFLRRNKGVFLSSGLIAKLLKK